MGLVAVRKFESGSGSGALSVCVFDFFNRASKDSYVIAVSSITRGFGIRARNAILGCFLFTPADFPLLTYLSAYLPTCILLYCT